MALCPSKFLTLVSVVAFVNIVCLVILIPRYQTETVVLDTSTTRPILGINEIISVRQHTEKISQEQAYHEKPACPERSNFLAGAITVDMEWAVENYWQESHMNSSKYGVTSPMGAYIRIPSWDLLKPEHLYHKPIYCRSKLRIAIIVPFRNREPHLKILLGHLTPILRRQLIEYSLFVVEQYGNETFNKGRLMNTAFEFAYMLGEKRNRIYDCYLFHDVDLLPERDDIFYRCHSGDFVDHLAPSIDKFKYKPLCCGITVGGLIAFKAEQFRKVNGFSNSFWGWGGEDDDMNVRIRKHALRIVRPNATLARFAMIKHKRDRTNPRNIAALAEVKKSWSRSENDGLVDLDTEIKEFHIYPLFTKIFVDVKVPEDVRNNFTLFNTEIVSEDQILEI